MDKLKSTGSKEVGASYLNDKLESTGHIRVAVDNNHNVDIANSHVKERATPNLPHRTCTEFFCLHYMHSEGIHHISPRSCQELAHVSKHTT